MLLLGLSGADIALAQGPSWAYAEYARTWVSIQSDESGDGANAHISLPLSRRWFLAASGSRTEAQFDALPIWEEFERGHIGLGLHSTGTRSHMFASLSYVTVTERTHFTDGSRPSTRDRAEGGVLAMGVRGLLKPYLSFEPELGLGYFGDDHAFEQFARIKLALRLLPRVWLVGGYSSELILSDSHTWSAGVRLSWSDATPRRRRPPGAKLLQPADGAEGAWTSGTTLVALRLLRLQEKPLAGAAEIADLAAGATLVLHESLRNDFGTWWRVSAGDQAGWIREKELK